ncbi:MAG TPA: ABC transporter substrate-binding protein [Micromonosporaceae bacterium]|nr:ABC transporter substrate-binding protein [Micromonosporaceae bacterium]
MARSSAGQSPASSPLDASLTRRRLFGAAAAGAGALALPTLLAGCGDDADSPTGGTSSAAGGQTVSFGSNQSDPKPKAAYQSVFDAYKTKTQNTVEVNTVDHNTFQENINRYLQGAPQDVFTWFAGYRARFFAAQGLTGDISSVWKDIEGDYTSAFKDASTGDDKKQYFVPFTNYPWAIFYRKSVWQEKGYAVPKTLDELKALGAKMQKDGLTPIAFADKDGWPAMGTFDYLNMRTNGYDFHVNLMAGKEAWTDNKVKTVFDTWRGLMPLHQPGANGRTWQEAAQSLQAKQSGMYVLGMFVGQQFTEAADLADLDFFAFPEINSEHGIDSVEAPIDGFMMSKKVKNEAGAKDLLKFLAGAEAQNLYLKTDPTVIATNKNADTASYTPLQKKAVELISAAKHISQFLDRDTRPDFASTAVIPALQSFINNPNDIDGVTKNLEAQKKTIFAS